jgi:hypothetical protein
VSILLLTAQILLSAVLLVSGLAKVVDRRGTTDAMTSLRLPAPRLHPAVATLLPIGEIVLAIGPWIPVWGVSMPAAALTAGLMILYWVVIARALTFEERVSCSCFGNLGTPTVSRVTLVRNSLLIALAVLSVLGAVEYAPGLAHAASPVTILQLVAAVAITIVLTLVTIRVTTTGEDRPTGGTTDPDASVRGGRTADQQEEADLEYVRTPTPFGMLQREDEDPMTLASLTAQHAALLIWVRPGCGPCERVLSSVPAWKDSLDGILSMRTLFRSRPSDLAPTVRSRAGDTAAWDIEGNLAASLRAHSSPAAVLLGADGLLAGGPVAGADAVTELVEEIIAQIDEARREGDLPGAAAPSGSDR